MAWLKLISLVLISWTVGCRGSKEEKKLIETLLKDYDTRVRPVAKYADKMTVELGLIVRRLVKLCPKSDVMTLNAWLMMQWNDTYMTWDPADYGGIDRVYLRRQDVFTPDILIWNNADTIENDEMLMDVLVFSTGNAVVVDQKQFDSDCIVEKGQKEVTCEIKLGSWMYDASRIDVKVGDIDTKSFDIPNDYWQIKDVKGTREVYKFDPVPDEDYPYISFKVQLTSKSGDDAKEMKSDEL